MKVRCIGGPLHGQWHRWNAGGYIEYATLHSDTYVGKDLDVFHPDGPVGSTRRQYQMLSRADGSKFAVEAEVATEFLALQSNYEHRIRRARNKVLALVGLE